MISSMISFRLFLTILMYHTSFSYIIKQYSKNGNGNLFHRSFHRIISSSFSINHKFTKDVARNYHLSSKTTLNSERYGGSMPKYGKQGSGSSEPSVVRRVYEPRDQTEYSMDSENRRFSSASSSSSSLSYSQAPYRKYTKERSDLMKDRDDFDGDYLYGIAPVRMALKAKKRKIYELLVQEGLDVANKKDDKASQEILDLANSMKITMKDMSKHDMNMLTDSRPHQGFILKTSKIEFENIKSMPLESENKCVLALDEVWDPQNFGALVRTCHFLHIDQIVVCAKNSAPPSPVVSKSSSGALEVTPIYSTPNLMKFIDESVKNGWQVVGTSLSGNTIGLSELPLEKPTILVLGNEGHGIRTNILNRCTHLVRIGDGTSSDIDSLNVSVTGGILLHYIMQHISKK